MTTSPGPVPGEPFSSLRALLEGAVPPGVYLWHDDLEPAQARALVELAGWRFGRVDSVEHPGKAGFLRAVGVALGFPAYYGRNLDALADCLSDQSGLTVLVWDGWSELAQVDPATFAVVLEILGEHAWLAVLLRGDAPSGSELPLRRLDQQRP